MTTSKRDESQSQNFPGLPGNSYWHITDIRPLNPKRIRVKFLFVDISLLWQRRFPCLLLICTFTKIVAKLWPQSNERCIFLKKNYTFLYLYLSEIVVPDVAPLSVRLLHIDHTSYIGLLYSFWNFVPPKINIVTKHQQCLSNTMYTKNTLYTINWLGKI